MTTSHGQSDPENQTLPGDKKATPVLHATAQTRRKTRTSSEPYRPRRGAPCDIRLSDPKQQVHDQRSRQARARRASPAALASQRARAAPRRAHRWRHIGDRRSRPAVGGSFGTTPDNGSISGSKLGTRPNGASIMLNGSRHLKAEFAASRQALATRARPCRVRLDGSNSSSPAATRTAKAPTTRRPRRRRPPRPRPGTTSTANGIPQGPGAGDRDEDNNGEPVMATETLEGAEVRHEHIGTTTDTERDRLRAEATSRADLPVRGERFVLEIVQPSLVA